MRQVGHQIAIVSTGHDLSGIVVHGNASPVCTSVNSILNQSGGMVTVGTAVDHDSDILVSPVCAGVQAEVTNAKLNQISAKQNDFTFPSPALDQSYCLHKSSH